MRILQTRVAALALALASSAPLLASPQSPSWRYYRVGNTGIQGDYHEAVWVGPDGDPYIGGYDPIFEEGGFAKLVQAENRWINWSNVDYPVIGDPAVVGSTRIKDIVPDASGKLWMGTWIGALRFDPAVGASSLTHFGPANSQLNDDRVFDVDRAPDGTMWFVNNGIVRYDPSTNVWTRWNTGLPFLSAQPKAGGGYLIWSSDRPPFQSFTLVFDSTTQQWTTLTPTGAPGQVVGMPGKDCVDDAGNFWALRSTTPGGYDSLDYRAPNGAWTAPPEPYAAVTFDIWAFKAYGNRRAVLVDGVGGVYQFDGASWANLGVWRAGAFTESVDIDASGNVWVCGTGGAAKRNAQTGEWQRYRITNTGNYDDFNRDLTIDPVRQHVYTGANAGPGVGGMTRFDGQRWVGWNNATYGLGFAWPFPTDFCDVLAYRPSNGRVAVSPYFFYGIHEWTGSGFEVLRPNGGCKRMCEDSRGRLWALGEYFDLSYYDGGEWTSVPITAWGQQIRPDPTRPGTVWATTGYEMVRTDGVYRFSRTIDDFPELAGNSDQFSGLAVGNHGVAWIGCTVQYGLGGTGGGLIRIDADTGAYEMLRQDRGWPFPGQYVTPWAVTPDGRLWMQYDTDYPYTERGLCWWDGTTVGVFPAPPGGEPQWGGLPHGQIEDVEVRAMQGSYELWMSCVSRGLAVLTMHDVGTSLAYGCGVNPAGSLATDPGPILGRTLVLNVDNPLGTQHAGATSVLLFAAAPLAHPCGAPLPGWNMDPARPAAELLVAPPLVALGGPPWNGPGQPARFALPIPATPTLLGVTLDVQGALLDPIPPAPPVGLTEARALTFGL